MGRSVNGGTVDSKPTRQGSIPCSPANMFSVNGTQ
jgi:hypothetical protein